MSLGETRTGEIDSLIFEITDRAQRDRLIIDHDWALVALGGYGRGRLAPFSDIDLALIHKGLPKGDVNALVQGLFYPIWDAGLQLSHTVRSLKESVEFGREDLQWLTATLDARFLTGDRALFDEFCISMLRVARAKQGRPFLEKITDSAEARWRRFGNAGHLREPEIKEGHGGLRDIQVVRWLNKVLADETLPAPADAAALIQADDFLWKLRCVLHEAAGRDLNRVRIDWQANIAKRLFPEAPDPYIDFSRALFKAVRDVAEITERSISSAHQRVRAKRWFSDTGKSAATENIPETLTLPALLEILRLGHDGLPVLEKLSNSGVLEELVPEWAQVKGLSFMDPNHRHPVDIHLFLTVGELVSIRSAATETDASSSAVAFNRFLSSRLAEEILHPDWLLLAGLWHDIGKGRGSHAETGADMVGEISNRLGLDRHAGEAIGFLVRHHLLLSHVATRRDLDDPRTIDGVAAIVGDGDRLRMLYLLTLADAMATGPNAWNSWKSALVDELFLKTLESIEGRSGQDRTDQIMLTEKHFELLDRDEEIVTAFWPGKEGLGELTVVAPDHPGLISRIAGVLALNRINVLAAGLYSADNGRALEVFRVAAAFEPEVTKEMYQRVKTDISKALSGQLALSYHLDELTRRYQRGAKEREAARVVFDNGASDKYTIIEVHARDELGILYEITAALAELNLDIHFAKASTFGDRAVDVFYVSDLTKGKITEENYLKEIEKNILFRLSRLS
jgi:[protein-PII] uridylyltransferase